MTNLFSKFASFIFPQKILTYSSQLTYRFCYHQKTTISKYGLRKSWMSASKQLKRLIGIIDAN